jgi:hypothetical protein
MKMPGKSKYLLRCSFFIHKRAFFLLCFISVSLLTVSSSSAAIYQRATLLVPGQDLIFVGSGLLPPDPEGHFAIGIQLPQPKIKAEHCESPYLIVGLGELNKPLDGLTAADQRVIAHNIAYYDQLVAAAKSSTVVHISVRNFARYLRVSRGLVNARYCMLSIEKGSFP